MGQPAVAEMVEQVGVGNHRHWMDDPASTASKDDSEEEMESMAQARHHLEHLDLVEPHRNHPHRSVHRYPA